jgi:hypothetical protein
MTDIELIIVHYVQSYVTSAVSYLFSLRTDLPPL